MNSLRAGVLRRNPFNAGGLLGPRLRYGPPGYSLLAPKQRPHCTNALRGLAPPPEKPPRNMRTYLYNTDMLGKSTKT